MSTTIRVLIVEDSESDALLLVRQLEREGYRPTFERVDTPQTMRAALAARPWDLILADYSLPSFSAPDALALVHELELDLPFIVVSGTIEEAIAVDVLRAGAHDFILKGNWACLGPGITRALRDAAQRRERQRAEAALAAQARRFQAIVEHSSDATCPLSARIFAVADVWDALRSDRPYRPAWPEARVRDHIRALSETHFDPRVVAAFLQVGQLPA